MVLAERTKARISGPKPGLNSDRAARISQALAELRHSGAPFSVQDVAERAGVSRATIYRNTALRDLVGCHGDPDRAPGRAAQLRQKAAIDELRVEIRELKGRIKDTEAAYDRVRERFLAAEERLRSASKPESDRAAGDLPATLRSLRALANKLTPDEIKSARRQIARAMHPDLFPSGSAAHAITSELLKTLNSLIS